MRSPGLSRCGWPALHLSGRGADRFGIAFCENKCPRLVAGDEVGRAVQ